jgi:hypothetical protein
MKAKRKPLTIKQRVLIGVAIVLWFLMYVLSFLVNRFVYGIASLTIAIMGGAFILSPPPITGGTVPYDVAMWYYLVCLLMGMMMVAFGIYKLSLVIRGRYDYIQLAEDDDDFDSDRNFFIDTLNGRTDIARWIGIEPYYGDDVIDPNDDYQFAQHLEDDFFTELNQDNPDHWIWFDDEAERMVQR